MSAAVINVLNSPTVLRFLRQHPTSFDIMCRLPDLLRNRGFTNKQVSGVLWQATQSDIRGFLIACDHYLDEEYTDGDV